ncbi:hypothetical protein KIN20_035510 [Parelaphostrongylus tenuis]|uniref:DUF7027 domain-containing protein n=1 Tax=Parelaphostrongylus tenuis TaxID=148309 RepID=A0AAD5REJ6_PARTN|nr:hypothetical protein KIN20_035510 [Parelaphostrongylus tenuis]
MGSETRISNLKMAGIVVAVVEVLLCILSVYGLFRNLHLFGSSYLFWFVLGILSVIVIMLAIALMLYAIKKEKARWLIPHLSAQVFLILFLIIVAIVVAILLLFGAYQGIRNLIGVYDYHMSDESTFLIGIMMIIIYLLVALLEVFFLIIVWKLYKHLRDYRNIGHLTDEKNMQWENLGPPPKDNAHGSPTMGDVYPYGQEQGKML